MRKTSLGIEARALLKQLRNMRMLLLISVFLPGQLNTTYQGNYLATYCTVRSRASSLFLTAVVGAFVNVVTGAVVDIKRFERSIQVQGRLPCRPRLHNHLLDVERRRREPPLGHGGPSILGPRRRPVLRLVVRGVHGLQVSTTRCCRPTFTGSWPRSGARRDVATSRAWRGSRGRGSPSGGARSRTAWSRRSPSRFLPSLAVGTRARGGEFGKSIEMDSHLDRVAV
ncbi:hypothetical protein LZ32DRAFT_665819, partial [Colletotrichum eremochloae]